MTNKIGSIWDEKTITCQDSTIPDEHLEALREIDDSQPRSVMMLNALARNDGMPVYYTDSSAELPAPEKPTLH